MKIINNKNALYNAIETSTGVLRRSRTVHVTQLKCSLKIQKFWIESIQVCIVSECIPKDELCERKSKSHQP